MKRELIPALKQIQKVRTVLTEDEVQSFFTITRVEDDEIMRVRNELFMRVAFYTGVRLSENLNLTFDQLL
jgi:site-specific recombinase XerD